MHVDAEQAEVIAHRPGVLTIKVRIPTPPMVADLLTQEEELGVEITRHLPAPEVLSLPFQPCNARSVIALVNPNMPRTHGDSFVHVSRLDYAVKWGGPLYEVDHREVSETQAQIGRNVAQLIEDGATLQACAEPDRSHWRRFRGDLICPIL